MDNATIYFSKSTNKELYKYVNILEYHDGTYVLTNPISEHNLREMRNNMDDADAVEFDKFIMRNWGIKLKGYENIDDVTSEDTLETATITTGGAKRGRKPKNAE